MPKYIFLLIAGKHFDLIKEKEQNRIDFND